MNESSDHLPERLLQQTPWMRRLAAELVSSPDAADDLLQDAWVEALRRPPRQLGRSWLSRVLENLARQRGRRRERAVDRLDPEDAATGPAHDVVALAEVHQWLVEELLRLDEPLRKTLLLRFFQGMRPGAIGRELGVPASTVRTWQHRGLQRLRGALTPRLGDRGRGKWAALIALGSHPKARAASWSSTPVVVSGVAALLIGLGGLWVWDAMRDARDVQNGAVLSTFAPVDEMDEPTFPVPAERSKASSAGAAHSNSNEAPASAEYGVAPPLGVDGEPATRTVTVHVLIDGDPAKDGEVHLRESGGWISMDSEAERDLDSQPIVDGAVTFDVASDADFTLAVDRRGDALLQRNASAPNTDDLIVLRLGTASVHGTVYGASGQPLAGALITLGVRDGWNYGAVVARVRTDAGGQYDIQHLPASRCDVHVEGHALREGVEQRATVSVALGESKRVDLGRPEPSLELRGRLVNQIGQPVDLLALGPNSALEFVRRDGSIRPEVLPAMLEAEGAFLVQLTPNRHRVRLRWPGQISPLEIAASFTPDERDLRPTLVLPGCQVTLDIVDASTGRTLPPDDVATLGVTLTTDAGRSPPSAGFAVRTKQRGLALEAVAAGDWTLQCSGADLLDGARLTVQSSDRRLNHRLVVRPSR